MPGINTVFGPIHPEQMGITGIFEHLSWGPPGWADDPVACKNQPHIFSKWQKELVRYKNMGGGTLLEFSGADMGRPVELFRLLSRATGIHIMLSTGFAAQTGAGGIPTSDIDCLSEFLVRELTQGIEGTKVRAGFIQVGYTTYSTEGDEATLRAAIRAAKKTGCCVIVPSIHTAIALTNILKQEGLDPSRVVIGHGDGAAIDREKDKEFCRQGFYVAFDHIGTEPTWSAMPWALSDWVRADLVKALISEGFINQVIVAAGTVAGQGSQSLNFQLCPSAAGALLHFLAKLHRVGVKEDQIHTLLVENPKRVLPF